LRDLRDIDIEPQPGHTERKGGKDRYVYKSEDSRTIYYRGLPTSYAILRHHGGVTASQAATS